MQYCDIVRKRGNENDKNIIFDIGGIVLEWGNKPLIELLNKTDYEVNKICKIIYGDSRFKECILIRKPISISIYETTYE